MTTTSPVTAAPRRRGLVRKVSSYVAGSLVATVCSEGTLVVCYGLLHLSAGPAAIIAWFAGAIPNYWINRSWTWQRSGRPSLRREIAPYLTIVLVTLVIVVAATHIVSAALSDQSDATRTFWVGVTYLGVFVLMSVLRFVLFDRLFGALHASERRTVDPPEETS